MRFYIDIKCLWFNLWIWGIVHAWYGPSTWEMMQICSKLMEFCSCGLLLKLCLFNGSFSWEFFQLFSNFFILGLNMLKITFSCIEVVFIFPAIVTTIIFLYYFSLFIEKFALFIFHFFLFLIHKLATANIAPPDSLYFQSSSFLIIEIPFYSEHAPVFLHYHCSRIFFVSIFLSFIYHCVISINKIPMSLLTLFNIKCHDKYNFYF